MNQIYEKAISQYSAPWCSAGLLSCILFLIVLDAREISINFIWLPFYVFFSFLYRPEFMPVSWPALLCCILFAWLWWTSSGVKSVIYYILSLFFTLVMCFGSLLFAYRKWTMPGDTIENPTSPVPYFIVWALFVGCILALELYSRLSSKK